MIALRLGRLARALSLWLMAIALLLEPGFSTPEGAQTPRPLLLIAQLQDPPQEGYNPNIDLIPALTAELKDLRKFEVVVYAPNHPTVQRFANENGVDPKLLNAPDSGLLLRIASAWEASYLLIVRCVRPKAGSGEKSFPPVAALTVTYSVEVWQTGRRTPLWRVSGNQQVMDSDPALRSLARTLVLRLNSEVWQNLPTLPESPLPVERRRESVQAQDAPATSVEQLIREGRLSEALPLLRARVNQNPLDVDARLRLIELYQRLGLNNAALEECERAMQLMPHEQALLLIWARLMREQGRLDDAIRVLQQARQSVQDARAALTLALTLFDFQLLTGDFDGAEETLKSLLHSERTPSPLWGEGAGEGLRWRLYLLQGVRRQFEPDRTPIPLSHDQLPLLLFVAKGILNDLSSELLDLRRLASDPAPDWKALRERGERIVVRALDSGAWLARLQPDEGSRDALAHLQFGAHLMAQAAQQMARYLLFRKAEDMENATLLRAEAMRELDEALRLSEQSLSD